MIESIANNYLLKVMRMIMLVMVYYLLIALLSSNLSAQETPDLVILNSNHSINKYAITQKIFLADQDMPARVINLQEQSDEKVADIIRRNHFKIIYCIGAKAYLLAHRLAPKAKIVFSSAINWQRLPKAESHYGIAQELPAEMQLTMFRYLFPEIKKIGILYSQQFNKQWLARALQAAQDVGIEITIFEVSPGQNIGLATKKILTQADALWLIPDPLVLTNKKTVLEIFHQAKKIKKPIFTYNKIFMAFGAQLIISADIPTIGRQVSALVNTLRNNQTIANRVSYPAGSHVILNMKKLEGYSIQLNKEALGSVNQIIE